MGVKMISVRLAGATNHSSTRWLLRGVGQVTRSYPYDYSRNDTQYLDFAFDYAGRMLGINRPKIICHAIAPDSRGFIVAVGDSDD